MVALTVSVPHLCLSASACVCFCIAYWTHNSYCFYVTLICIVLRKQVVSSKIARESNVNDAACATEPYLCDDDQHLDATAKQILLETISFSQTSLHWFHPHKTFVVGRFSFLPQVLCERGEYAITFVALPLSCPYGGSPGRLPVYSFTFYLSCVVYAVSEEEARKLNPHTVVCCLFNCMLSGSLS